MAFTWSRVLGAVGILVSVFLAIWWVNTSKLRTSSASKSNLPILTRLDPVKVGYVREMQLVSGQTHKIRTLSMRPALFEIENFLSVDECDDIIFMAQTQGLESSQTLVGKLEDDNDTIIAQILSKPEETFKTLDANENGAIETSELATGMQFFGEIIITNEVMQQIIDDLDLDVDKNNVISFEEFTSILQKETLQKMVNRTNSLKADKPTLKIRVSNTAFINHLDHVGKRQLFEDIKRRIQLVTGLPKDVIWTSEDMQVLRYDKSGHYHCHYDSEVEEEFPNITCCHYFDKKSDSKCLPCRYMTFFYYLNEPEEGGETAFPIADNDSTAIEMIRGEQHHLCDLSNYCHAAKITYKPKRGTALFWYNHEINQENGWLGELDKMSYHGGCDVTKGTKWAANNWINAGKSREKDISSWADYKHYVEDYDNPDKDTKKKLTDQKNEDQGKGKGNEMENENARENTGHNEETKKTLANQQNEDQQNGMGKGNEMENENENKREKTGDNEVYGKGQ